nr:unnamed protein product [Callosobruchus analis]
MADRGFTGQRRKNLPSLSFSEYISRKELFPKKKNVSNAFLEMKVHYIEESGRMLRTVFIMRSNLTRN